MYCISWQSRNVACVVHFVCGLFVMLNLAYKVVKKKHVFSFFIPAIAIMSYQSVAWLSFNFRPYTLQFTRYGLVACYLRHIAMLRTYSYECWFHPELHKRFFWCKREKVIGSC